MLLFCLIGYIEEKSISVSLPIGMLVNMLLPKRIIIKSKKHLEHIARNFRCLKCGTEGYGIQATHIRHTDSTGNIGWGSKGGDIFTVPLCYLCHEKQHTMNEIKFWTCVVKINPIQVAYNIALKSPCLKIKQLAKEGKVYEEAIKYYDNLQSSTNCTT